MKKWTITFIFLLVGALFTFAQNENDKYQLQIYEGTMQEVKILKESFQQKNPKIKIYLYWESPNGRLFAGECGTKKEVEKLQKALLIEYPHSIIKICQD
jgi:hypothetical protein